MISGEDERNDYYDDIECSTKNGWKAVYIKYYIWSFTESLWKIIFIKLFAWKSLSSANSAIVRDISCICPIYS